MIEATFLRSAPISNLLIISMYRRILVPIDGRPETEVVLDRAHDLARKFEAELHAMHVVDSRLYDDLDASARSDVESVAKRAGDEALNAVRDRLEDIDGELTQTIRSGVPHTELLAYIEANDIDLVVMGRTSKTPPEIRELGSTTERLLRRTDVPVLTVRQERDRSRTAPFDYQDILIPTDGSDPSFRAAEHAIEFATRHNSTIHAVYVVDTSIFHVQDAPRSILGTLRKGGKTALADIEELAAEESVSVTTSLVEGDPNHQILEYAEGSEIELICLGRRGRTGLPEVLLGSTTVHIVRDATVPVFSTI